MHLHHSMVPLVGMSGSRGRVVCPHITSHRCFLGRQDAKLFRSLVLGDLVWIRNDKRLSRHSCLGTITRNGVRCVLPTC